MVLALSYSTLVTVVPLHAAATWGASAGQIGLAFSATWVTAM
jgi:hypothetical protein